MRVNLVALLFGATFGFAFSAAGFNQYDIVHRTLLLQYWAPWLVFASAMVTALPLLWLLERRRWRTPLGGPLSLKRWKADRNRVMGGAVFGVGWAVTGACPGTASTMVAGGSLLGLVILAGILAGIWLRDTVVERPSRASSDPLPGAATVRT
jgi:uncharacterized membrane protein YedE/YeeE